MNCENTDNPISLTQSQWNQIQHLQDLLAEHDDYEEGLQLGLEYITGITQRSGVALYYPAHLHQPNYRWHYWNVPDPIEKALKSNQGPIFDIITKVIDSGQFHREEIPHNIAACYPIFFNQLKSGAMLFFGAPVLAEEQIFFQAIVQSFRRSIRMVHHSANGLRQTPAYLDLLKSRNTLRAMFDNLPLSIYIIDENYKLIAVNHSRSIRAGEEPRQLVGRKCFEKFYNRTSPCNECKAAETVRSGQTFARNHREWIKKDAFQELEINTFPIFDDEDHVVQAIIIEVDVTEKRILEANLIQSEKLAAVGQLAAGVAHEINNPLTAIIANTQILRREVPADQEDILESLKLIELAGTRASQVIRNLLGIARKEKYEFLPVDLNETVRTSLSLVQHQIIGRPVRIILNLQDDMPEVIASQDQLQGVWINLILNALDALDKEPGEITITTSQKQGNFYVTITDNGKGISKDHLPKVFEPFFTTKTFGHGTGLGLSVCSRVLRHHGGDIHVDSQPGEWTRFTVMLPANH